jgi:hypothetical protein
VRIGNQAAEQLQHDSYGSVILAAAQMFIDERLPRMGDAGLFHRLEPLGAQARRFAFEPDAGPWEYRRRQRVHTHSATMCWVACVVWPALPCGSVRRPRRAWAATCARPSGVPGRAARRLSRRLDHDDSMPAPLLPELGLPHRRALAPAAGLNRNGFIARCGRGRFRLAFLVCQFWYTSRWGAGAGAEMPPTSRAAMRSACVGGHSSHHSQLGATCPRRP